MIPIQVKYEKENDMFTYTEHVHKTLVSMGYDFTELESKETEKNDDKDSD